MKLKFTILLFLVLPLAIASQTTDYDTLETAVWHLEPGFINTPRPMHDLLASYYVKKGGSSIHPDTGFIYLLTEKEYKDERYGNVGHGAITKYNILTQTWNSVDSFPVWRTSIKPVQLGGKIYLVSGNDPGRGCLCNLEGVDIYDIERDTVEDGAPVLTTCEDYAAGTYGDSLIYIMGGGSPPLADINAIQIYNVKTRQWAYGTPFPGVGRAGVGGGIIGNKIILAGGFSYITGIATTFHVGIIDPKDPYNISWTTRNIPEGFFSNWITGVWYGKKNKLIFFASDSAVNAYDVQKDKWFRGPDRLKKSSYIYSDMMPVIRNDSVFMVIIGNPENTDSITNEWLYIGIDEPDTYIGVNEEPNLNAPKEYSLSQNYPNPFNPSTKIKYSLREPGHVSLTVYDMLGREIKTLINELMSAGEHEFIFNAAELNLSSGIYLYRIQSGNFVQTKKLMLIK